MQIPCFKCGGDGHLPQYAWNKAGVCFTCGGDGTVNTFSATSLNRKSDKEVKTYLEYSSNRDLANAFLMGEAGKLDKGEHLSFLHTELRKRAHEHFGFPKYESLSMDDIRSIVKQIDDLEKNMPKPYEDSAYFKAGKVDLVPVRWLMKFQGNNLRKDDDGMKEFADKLVKEGLREPVMLMIGQADKTVGLGEGNHRMNAFIKAGLDYIPVRVARRTGNVGTPFHQYYDRMSNVPTDDYFKADASPKEVFDTFYDRDFVSTLDAKLMKKIGHDEIPLPAFDGKLIDAQRVAGIYGKKGKSVSKTLAKKLDEMISEAVSAGISKIDIERALMNEGEWKSKENGVLLLDINDAIAEVDELITEEKFSKLKKAMNKVPDNDDDDLFDLDIDELDSLLDDI